VLVCSPEIVILKSAAVRCDYRNPFFGAADRDLMNHEPDSVTPAELSFLQFGDKGALTETGTFESTTCHECRK
jgi:hypothetical protein